MAQVLSVFGVFIAVCTIAAILWSVAFPAQRVWPPHRYTALTPFLVWIPTFSLFGILIALGVWGWGELGVPAWIRFGIGVPFIVLGSAAVWFEVLHFGVPQTGGAAGTLRTEGLYRFSRNPQYVADTVMVIGWLLLSASLLAVPVGCAAIAALLIAPLSEEPWMQERYGSAFESYKSRVRRFL